jgi:hypothetical protein
MNLKDTAFLKYLEFVGVETTLATESDYEDYCKGLAEINKKNNDLKRTGVISGGRPQLTADMRSELLVDRKQALSNYPTIINVPRIIEARTASHYQGAGWAHNGQSLYSGSPRERAILAFKGNQSLYSKLIRFFNRLFKRLMGRR